MRLDKREASGVWHGGRGREREAEERVVVVVWWKKKTA